MMLRQERGATRLLIDNPHMTAHTRTQLVQGLCFGAWEIGCQHIERSGNVWYHLVQLSPQLASRLLEPITLRGERREVIDPCL